MKKIKNIVFDVGNVLVRWDPRFIISQAFPQHHNPAELATALFKNQIWLNLNLGLITEQEALRHYQQQFGFENHELQNLMEIAKASLTPIEESINLLKSLQQDFELYALTDNTKAIMAYLTQKYDFWPVFQGIVVSAEVGHLKPSQEIYQHLLSTYQLIAKETVFIDDYLINVEGARKMGIHAIQFQNTQQCILELQKFILI